MSIRWWVTSDQWPVNRTRSALSVFFNVLNGALFALNDVNYVVGATIGVGFYFKCLSGRRAVDCYTFLMWAHVLQRGCRRRLFPEWVSFTWP